MAKKKSNRQEGWKIVKRTVTSGLGGPGVERIERVRTCGVLKKLASAFIDELFKIAGEVEESQIRAGTAVEKEHTNSPVIARKIALDHLEEHPDYYRELKKMEAKLERK